MLTGAAVAVAAGLEFALAEPPARLHPVAWFGRLVAPLDREWGRPRLVGLAGALALPALAGAVVAGTVWLAASVHLAVGAAVGGLAVFSTTSLRMLLTEARETVAATETDLDAARDRLLALAGRDAGDLSPGLVRSAAVESAAENLADGLVAPLSAVALVALPAWPLSPLLTLVLAAGTAAWVKAVNTLDSMLGYRSKPVGWAPARLDDAVMWVPARLSAALLALAAGRPSALARAREWTPGVPSLNSGWPMGTLAAAADCRLEKPGVYVLHPAAGLPSTETSRQAVAIVARTGAAAYLLAAAAALVPWGVGAWS